MTYPGQRPQCPSLPPDILLPELISTSRNEPFIKLFHVSTETFVGVYFIWLKLGNVKLLRDWADRSIAIHLV